MACRPETLKLFGGVNIGNDVFFGECSLIGYGVDASGRSNLETRIGNNCKIGSQVIIYCGSKIGDNTEVEDFCRIGGEVTIAKNCRIIYGAKIYEKTVIGEGSIIGGFICERADIGRNVRIFGDLVHKYTDPSIGWDEVEEKSPIVEDNVVIGFGAKILGGIRIGKNSYVAAGAIVKKDVAPCHVVNRQGRHVPIKDWSGTLKNSNFFKSCFNEKK